MTLLEIRQFIRASEKITRRPPSGNLPVWFWRHQARLSDCQSQLNFIGLYVAVSLLGALIALVAALSTTQSWLWLVALLAFGLSAFIYTYYLTWRRALKQLQAQNDLLLEKLLKLKTKPWLSLGEQILLGLSQLVKRYLTAKKP